MSTLVKMDGEKHEVYSYRQRRIHAYQLEITDLEALASLPFTEKACGYNMKPAPAPALDYQCCIL